MQIAVLVKHLNCLNFKNGTNYKVKIAMYENITKVTLMTITWITNQKHN